MKQIFSQIAQGDQGVLGRAEALHESLQATKLDVLQGAVDGAIQDRADNFMAAVQCYRDHPFRRQLNEPPVVWQEGSTRLLDYDWEKDRCGPGRQGAKQPIAKQPILVVPSLINRSYILDLLPDQSFLRWLAKQGFRPLLVDWDAPGPAEKGFELTDYVAGRLEACLNFVRADQERGPHSSATRKPVVLGYCMGGLLALALAQRRPEDLAGAVFLATPWDFHADGPDRARLLAASLVPLAPLMEAAGELPVDT
ncbi:MAG: alpha/beta fold hydrolase, partial [Pseudomonadota bacterium]